MKDLYPELDDYQRGWFDRADRYNQQSKIYILIADTEVKIGHATIPQNRFTFVRNQASKESGAAYHSFVEYKTKSYAPLIERKLLSYYKPYLVRKREHFSNGVLETFDMMVRYFDNQIIETQIPTLPDTFIKDFHFQNKIYYCDGLIGTISEINEEFCTLMSIDLSSRLMRHTGTISELVKYCNTIDVTKFRLPRTTSLAYDNVMEWKRDFTADYNYAKNNCRLTECTKHMRFPTQKVFRSYVLKRCDKYDTFNEFKVGEKEIYKLICSEGLVKVCKKIFIEKNRPHVYTKEECLSKASLCKTRSDWQRGNINYYKAALRNGWNDDCIKHLPKYTSKNGCTKEEARIEALKYDRRSDWQFGCGRTYQAAFKHGWLEELCGHMKPSHKKAKKSVKS